MKRKILLMVMSVLGIIAINAQTLVKKMATTNSNVNTTLQVGDTVYIGGDFTQVYTPAKGLARFTPGNIRPDIDFPQLGGSDYLRGFTTDGNGGFYLSGYFDNYNGTTFANPTAVIHILSDGTLDPAFGRVNDNNGYTIYALKKQGSRLYVGGSFTKIQNVNRSYFAALDAATGALLPWLPDAPNSTVYQIDATDSLVFLRGGFSNVGGYRTVNNFAVLQTASGSLIKRFPVGNYGVNGFALDGSKLYLAGDFGYIANYSGGISKLELNGKQDINFPVTDGTVSAVLPDANGGYYIGGSFSQVGNQARNNIAHILADGSVDTAFKPSVNGSVSLLAASADTLYFGGSFTQVGGKTRNYVAGVSLNKGVLAAWNPNPNNYVNSIVIYGTTIYLGGYFTSVKGTTRNYAAAVNFANTLLTWAPNPNSYVYNMVANSTGSFIYLGGQFSTIKGAVKNYIAKVNTTTGDALGWAPQVNSYVSALALNGNQLYIGGSFNTVNSINRQYIAAVDTSTGNLGSFLADASDIPSSFITASGKLYVAGNFTSIQGVARDYLARFDLGTGLIDNLAVAPGFNGALSTVVVSGSSIVVAGNFGYSNLQARNQMAAIDLSQPGYPVTAWNPAVTWSGCDIQSFLHYGKDIFIGGSFSYTDNVGGVGKNVSYIISLNDSSGLVSNHFAQYPDNYPSGLSIYDNKLMLAGGFGNFINTANGSNYSATRYLAGYNLSDWQLATLNYNPDQPVYWIFNDAANRLKAIGGFNVMNQAYRNYLAAIDLNTGLPTAFDPSPNSSVYTMAVKDTSLFIGGYFSTLNNPAVTRNYLAAVSTITGKVTPWVANANNVVYNIAIKDTIVYVGGEFTNIKNTARNRAAAFSTSGTGLIKPWAPNADGYVEWVLPIGTNVYISGGFSSVKGAAHPYIAKCNNTDGSPASWNPAPDGVVHSLANVGNTLYVSGSFSTIATKTRYSVAAFDVTANTLTSFDPKLLSTSNYIPDINPLVFYGKTMFFNSDNLGKINGVARGNIAAYDTVAKAATSFNPLPNTPTYYSSMSIGKNRLSVGGSWSALGNNTNNPYFAVFNLGPLTAPGNLNFTSLQPTSVKVALTKGDGEGRLFLAKLNGLIATPADGAAYTPNSMFGTGAKTPDSAYAVYSGNLDSVTVTGLKPNKTYRFSVYEYNGAASGIAYLSSGLSGTVTTPCPVYNLHVTPNDSAKICTGGTAVLNAPAGFKTYTWNTGDTTAQVAKPAGNYTVNYVDTDGCAGSSVVAVILDAKPNLGKDSTVKICPGSFINITGIYNTASYTTVTWNIARPDSAVAGKDTLIVTNATGCKDTAVITVGLNVKPNLGADKSVKICSGKTTNLTTLYSTSTYASVVWNTATPTKVGKGSYTLIVTNATGCMDTAVVKVDTVALPKTPLITLTGSAGICIGDTALLTASNYTDTTVAISWLRNDTVINGATAKTYNAVTGGNYKLRYTNKTGCVSTSSAIAITSGGVKPPVPVITQTGSTSFCLSDSLVLTANASTGLQWYRNNNAIKLATNSKYVVKAGGSYKLRVSGGPSCFSTSDSVIVTVTQVAKPTITLVNDTLVSSAATGNQWFENGVLIVGETGKKYSPNDIDIYTVQVTSGACKSQMSDQFIYTANTFSKLGNTKVLLYPNPAANSANLQLSGFKAGIIVTITDMTGKVVWKQDKLTNKTYTLPLANLATGVYIVTIKDNMHIRSLKLVKANNSTF